MVDAGVIIKVIRPFAICGGLWMTYKMAQHLASGNKSAIQQFWTWVGVITVFPFVPWCWMYTAQDAHPIASVRYAENMIATACVIVIAALYGMSDGHREWKRIRDKIAFHPNTVEEAIGYLGHRKRDVIDDALEQVDRTEEQ
jgi:hypothetical protein